MIIDRQFNEKNQAFLKQILSELKIELKGYPIVKMPKNAERKFQAVGLSGQVFDNKVQRWRKTIFLSEAWIGERRRRYMNGGFARKNGIRDGLLDLVLHEKAHNLGVKDEKGAEEWATKKLQDLRAI